MCLGRVFFFFFFFFYFLFIYFLLESHAEAFRFRAMPKLIILVFSSERYAQTEGSRCFVAVSRLLFITPRPDIGADAIFHQPKLFFPEIFESGSAADPVFKKILNFESVPDPRKTAGYPLRTRYVPSSDPHHTIQPKKKKKKKIILIISRKLSRASVDLRLYYSGNRSSAGLKTISPSPA